VPYGPNVDIEPLAPKRKADDEADKEVAKAAKA